MKNEKRQRKLKTELKRGIYARLLPPVKLMDFPLLRSGASICANSIETQAASSKKLH
jgi:hypothetical protein